MIRLIFLLLFLLLNSGCEKINYYPDKPNFFYKTFTLAHRGGGNDTLRENTLNACKFALARTDGIEVDIQISKDRTIWLSHYPIVIGCNGEQKCFIETSDSEIEQIKLCSGKDVSYTKLEDVMKYMYENSIYKYISIDLKGWMPCHISTLDIEGDMRLEGELVVMLGEKYNLAPYLLFETNIMTVLNWVKKKNKNVSAYITSFGDFRTINATST